MPEGRRPKGVIPRPRSGAVAESARLRWRMNGLEELPLAQEELPLAQGQGRRPGGATLRLRSGAMGEKAF